MSAQPEALRLADILHDSNSLFGSETDRQAAAELRRQHALIEQMLEALHIGRDFAWMHLQNMREAYRGYPSRYAADEAYLARIDAAIEAAKEQA